MNRPEFHPLQAEEIAGAFNDARMRGVTIGIFRVACLRDIIASKRASGRQKDMIELPLLESFRTEYEKRQATPLRSAANIAGERNDLSQL